MRLRLLLLRLLLRRLRLLKRGLGLLRLRLWQRGRGSSAESRAGATANISASRVDGPREMICQTQPAGRYHDEKFGILKSAAL